MGGIMPNHQRDAAIKRLRAAAVEAIAAGISQIVAEMLVRCGLLANTWAREEAYIRKEAAFLRLSEAWKAFPECERDEQVPPPEEIIARCDAYDRQKEEQERIAARDNL